MTDTPKLPPQNIEAEQSFLGACILDAKFVFQKCMIHPEDFYKDAHKRIFTAIQSIYSRGDTVDLVVLGAELKSAGYVESCGGMSYLALLVTNTPTAANCRSHEKIILNLSQQRNLIHKATSIISRAYEGEDSDKLIYEMRMDLSKLQHGDSEVLVTHQEIILQTMDFIEKRSSKQGELSGMPTGFKDMDILTDGWQPSELIIIAGRPGMGKASHLDAKILTISGWSLMRDIKIGDMVAGAHGEFNKVLGVYPQGMKEIYEVVLNDGGKTKCCSEHLWLTKTRKNRKSKANGSVKSLKDIMKSIKVNKDNRLNHSIPYVQPINFIKLELPINPYIMGIYLGDGTSNKHVRIHNPEVDILDKVGKLLPDTDCFGENMRIGRSIKRKIRCKQPSSVKQYLAKMGLLSKTLDKKFIPKDYLLSDIHDRVLLLQGLCDSDGYVCDGGGGLIEYSTESFQLTEDIKFLVGTLGGRCTFRKIKTYYTKNRKIIYTGIAYRGMISFTNDIVPVSSKKHLLKWKPPTRCLERFIKEVNRVGMAECQCILVDSPEHLYVTDDFIITHNTALLSAFAHAPAARGFPVGQIHLEMGKTQLGVRAVAEQSGIPIRRLRTGSIEDKHWGVIAQACGYLSTLPIYSAFSSYSDVQISRTIDDMALDKKCKLIGIDYLQLAKTSSQRHGMSREQEISSISRMLKQKAKEYEIPIIALCSLNRQCEARPDKRPILSDLRESGAIEQDADVVGFIYRDELYNKDTEDKGIAEVIFRKGRMMELDTIRLQWDGSITTYRDLILNQGQNIEERRYPEK